MSAASAIAPPDAPAAVLGRPRARVTLLVVANVLGVLAFAWPFVLPALAGPATENHRVDGPWILLGIGAAVGALLFLELGRGGMGPKVVALLGVLGAAIVALRLPGYLAGFSAMFIVVLVAGNAFGPAFGFLLGAIGMFASGLFVGGLGPWLPFEMVAFGWVGAGAGLLPAAGTAWPVRLGALAAYGAVAGLLYGAVMNLWTWPFIADGSAIAWDPNGGLASNVHHYVSFYLVSSLAWDLARSVGNVVLVLAVGRPLLQALDRAAVRMQLTIDGCPVWSTLATRDTISTGRDSDMATTKRATKTSTKARRTQTGRGTFTADERAAMRERAKELKAEAAKADGEKAVLEKIAEMRGSDRAMAKRIHAVVMEAAPGLAPKTWYGMPAYAKDGKILCFFQSAAKFDARYATFGFSDEAKLDQGGMWSTAWALRDLTAAEEKKIATLVKRAAR